MRSTVALLIVSGAMARAQPVSIEGLKDLLIPARQHAGEHLETRGATPELTRVKHYLRDWIESRLTPLDKHDEETVLAFQLNAEITKAGLTCEYPYDKCPEQNFVGFLGDIQMRRSGEFLIVQTQTGIRCGNDGSAYIYQWREGAWRRYWESERNDYTKDNPQYFRAVLISGTNYSPHADKSEHLIVTLGQYPWCSSNWQTIYSRIWRTSGGGRTQLLVDADDYGFTAEPLSAAVWPNDVLIEYAIGSIDGGVHNRRRIRHYVLNHGALKRTDPYVLSPRDFADEVITGDPKLKGPFEFIEPTLHCTQQKDLWQVGVQNPETEKPVGYFLVRWRPPYNFSLAGLSDHPSPGCTEKDPKADEFRTLFPDRDQH